MRSEAIKKLPPKVTRKKPPKSLQDEHAADVFDPRFIDPNNQITPLGLLIEIEKWCRRYEGRVKDINTALALKKAPGFNPFDVIYEDVKKCIIRECPELQTEKGVCNVYSPLENIRRKKQSNLWKCPPPNRKASRTKTKTAIKEEEIPF